jgi:hypothetical protein
MPFCLNAQTNTLVSIPMSNFDHSTEQDNSKPSATAPSPMSGTATAISGYFYPTVVSWGYPHLEVFTSSQNHSNYWKHRGLSNSDTVWQPTDGSFASFGGTDANFDTSLAAISRKLGIVDIFLTGNESATLWQAGHTYHDQNGIFPLFASNQTVFDGPNSDSSFITAPAAVSWDANRVDAFLLGTDNALYQIYLTSPTSSSPIIRLGGNWALFVPTAVSWGEGRTDVFVVDPTTKQLYHTYFSGGVWQPAASFERLGGYCTSRPIAVSWANGRIDVFVRGGDAGLWHLSYNGTWPNWTSISGDTSIQGEPEAICWGVNRIDVFAWGTDQSLLHKSFDGAQWTPPENFDVLGGGLGGPPKAVSDAPGSLHVFCFSKSGALQHVWYNQTQGAWSPSPAGSFEQLGTPPGGI